MQLPQIRVGGSIRVTTKLPIPSLRHSVNVAESLRIVYLCIILKLSLIMHDQSQVEFRNIDVMTDALVGSSADPTVGQVNGLGLGLGFTKP